MRKMSFALTIPQFKAGTKTVTRRQGWRSLKPGDIVMGVEKGMGLKKGEKVRELHPIKILSVHREFIDQISRMEVALEGFPNQSPEWFIAMYCKANKVHESAHCTRIEFEHLGGRKVFLEDWAGELMVGQRVMVRTRAGHTMSSHIYARDLRTGELLGRSLNLTVQSSDGSTGVFGARDQSCYDTGTHFEDTRMVPCPPELDQTTAEFHRRHLDYLEFDKLSDATIAAIFAEVTK